MIRKVFISSGRADLTATARLMHDYLEAQGLDVFMDLEDIELGDNFVEAINKEVAKADIVLALIGPRWEEELRRRAGEPRDFVRLELEAAIDQGRRVLPVLVDGAPMPAPEALPGALSRLPFVNSPKLLNESFRRDAADLFEKITGAPPRRRNGPAR